MIKLPEENLLVQMLVTPETRGKAFEQIVNKYSSRLYWYIRHMVTYHDDANDILQNTFIKAWMNLDTFRSDSKISTWLYKIAINESLTFIRQQKDNVSLENLDNSFEETLLSDEYFDGDEISIKLQQAIQSLPPKQRTVFNMKYYNDLKYEEMSEILETSIGSLKASYHIAVEKISKILEEN